MPNRRQPRINIGSSIVQATIDGVETVTVKNLSIGGVFVHLAKRRPIGETASVQIACGDLHVDIAARVTHIQSDGVGFAFKNPPFATIDAIQNLICTLLVDGADSDDRRDAERVMTQAAVVWRGTSGSQTSELADISVNGAFVRSSQCPAIGNLIDVYLAGFGYDLDARQPNELRGCRARVVNHRDGGFGIELIQPSAEFSMALNKLMAATASGEM